MPLISMLAILKGQICVVFCRPLGKKSNDTAGAMAFPTDFFTVLFAVARTAGWLAQWEEMLNDKEQKIARPRQIYVGYGERPFQSKLASVSRRSRRTHCGSDRLVI